LRLEMRDAFSDPGGASSSTDWPVVRVSAVADSPVAKKAGSTHAAAASASMLHTPERRSSARNSSSFVEQPTSSVAARRRVRTQLRSSGLGESSNNNNVSPPAAALNSPYAMKRYLSTDSSTGSSINGGDNRRIGSAVKATDHVANYSNHPRANTSAAPPPTAAQQQTPGGKASSSVASSSESSEFNLFDSTNNTGFSFDAFGLDKAEIDRQVGEAMNDLAGSHPDMSMFFQDPADDFASTRWDHSTTASPTTNNDDSGFASLTATSPPPPQDGFVDGFRVATKASNNLPVHVRNSPARSDRSSLTSESVQDNNNYNATAGVNMFKQQAGFHKSKSPSSSSSNHRGSGNLRMMNNFRSTSSPKRASQSKQPQIPVMDSAVSPRRRKEEVEFFGEDSSTSSAEAFKAPNHPLNTAAFAAGAKAQSEVGTDGGFASDVGVSSDFGPASEGGFVADFAGHLMPFVEVKEKKKSQHIKSESVRTESTAATTSYDEKKEEESSPAKTVGTLRSKWEAHESVQSREAAQRLRERQQQPSALSRDEIARLQAQLGSEILSPEKLLSPVAQSEEPQRQRVEKTRQEERAVECHDQRTSFASVKERLTSPVPRPEERARELSSKSEGGAAVRHSSVSSILSNLEKKESTSESRSDAGGSPAFYSVKLRKTGFPRQEDSSPTPNAAAASAKEFRTSPRTSDRQDGSNHNFESQAQRLFRQQQQQPQASPRVQNIQSPSPSRKSSPGGLWGESSPRLNHQSSSSSSPKSQYFSPSGEPEPRPAVPEKKLTYRERREIEIQKQKEEERSRQAQQNARSPAQRDVAALVKRRIAANRKNASSISSPVESSDADAEETISSLRNRLRPTGNTIDQETASASDTRSHEPLASEVEQSVPEKGNPVSQMLNERAASNPVAQLIQQRAAANPVAEFTEERSAANPVAQLIQQRAANPSPGPTKPKSPARSPQRKPADLVVETRDVGENSKVAANPAVSHMLLLQHLQQRAPPTEARSPSSKSPPRSPRDIPHAPSSSEEPVGTGKTPKATKMMLNAFLAGRESISSADGHGAPSIAKSASLDEQDTDAPGSISPPNHGLPALKDDPKYERYFKMLKVGMPMDVVKHAMTRDNLDPSVMDGDHSRPVGIPLKLDPQYSKYFKMLQIGLPMEAVKHSMERDGLDSTVMDQDHDLPAASGKKADDGDHPKEKDSHRRARLHWNTLRKVTSNSLWAQIDQDDSLNIEIDEQEFRNLFQAEKNETSAAATSTAASQLKRSSAVRVIDPKRANNGGIILARLKMSHDDMADAVDRIDEQALTAEQIENIIEYLPTKEEGKALESYMLEGGQDAAEKFEGLCECEKFMVSMMTVKHAKRKVTALLFKLQFESCILEIQQEARAIEQACEELSNSVRLRQLLGIVLTFGNRLNTAGNGKRKAGAFSLDSLLKLKQAKAFDKKTTFLHYIILIVRRNNESLLNFKDDIPTVFTSDKIFWDQCVADLEEVENQLENVRKIALYQAHQAHAYRRRRKQRKEDPDESLSDSEEALTLEEEVEALRATPIGMFTLSAIKYVSALRDKVEETKDMFAHLLEYFGEQERKLQPHELFSIIVTFSRDFEKAKEQVFENEQRKQREERKRQASAKKGKTPNGRPPAFSPNPPERRTTNNLKVSNLQPSMGGIIKELKSSPGPLKKTIDAEDPTNHDRPNPPESPESGDRRYNGESSFHESSPSVAMSYSPRASSSQNFGAYSPEMRQNRTESVPDRPSPSMAAVRAKAKMRMNNRSNGTGSSHSFRGETNRLHSGTAPDTIGGSRRSSSPDKDGSAQQPLSPRSRVQMEQQLGHHNGSNSADNFSPSTAKKFYC